MFGYTKLFAIAATLAVLTSGDSGTVSAEASAFLSDNYPLSQSFGTKSPYWDQRSKRLFDEIIYRFDMPTNVWGKQMYTHVQSQVVFRHGTRFPTASNTQEIMDLLAKLKNNYLASLPKWLQTYELPYNLTVEGQLAPTGYAELERLGERARPRIPASSAFGGVTFTYTSKSCTKESARAFVIGYLKRPNEVLYKENDPLLRFSDMCPRYQREVKDKDIAGAMVAAYEATPGMLSMVERFKEKLFGQIAGTVQADDITIKDVETAYSACSFDVSLYKKYKEWCTLLDDEMIDRIEYAEDLKTYYEEAHGSKINYEIASVLLKNIVGSMTNFVNGKSKVKGNFRFGHSETVVPLMALLGYSDAVEMPSEPTDEQIINRKFRGSVFGPFAANIEFRLYRHFSDDKYCVMIYVNEQLTKVPGCGEVLCPLETALKLWSYYLETYNFDQECA